MPRTSTLLAAALSASLVTHPASAVPADLPLSSITLYASGVGHFRHAGPVPAGGQVTLSLTAEELNDALKSLTVGGLSAPGGASGGVSVSYPGQAGIEERLASFGVDVRGVDSRFALLRRLRGVPVSVTTGGGDRFGGRVLAVEERTSVTGETSTTRRVLTLVSDDGLLDVDPEKVRGLKIDDERLAGELRAAMELLAGQRDSSRKPLTLTFARAAEDARVSYLAEAPLWKLSYRLDLSGDTPRLQGWAVVDNTSDRDWDGVEVTLVSGRPVSFVQDLYTPEYLQRPVVRPERFAGLVPQEHAQGDTPSLLMEAERAPMKRSRVAAPMAAAAELDAAGGFVGGQPAPAAQAGDLGELFAYRLDEPVTLGRGDSAMLPVLDGEVQAEPVSVYNAGVLGGHPMRGVRLTNTTPLKLDAGPVTVLDGDGGRAAYAGDARLGFTSPGDERLITYAVDLEVTATTDEATRSTRAGAAFDRGVLVIRVRERRERRFGFRNAAGEDRDLLVEVPRLSGYELLDAPEGTSGGGAVEETAELYRFPVVAPAGGSVELVATQARTRSERVSLVRLDGAGLDRLAVGGGLEPGVKASLQEAAQRRRAVAEAERAVAELDAERDRIAEEQKRIRENLQPLDRDSELRQRYVKLLGEQEDRLAGIVAERAEAAAEARSRREAFEGFVMGL